MFDEFMGRVEARIDAAHQAGTLDLGLETIAVEDFTILSDTLLRTDPASGATTHLLELEIARALKPLTLKRLEELHGLAGQRQRSEEHTSELQSLMRISYAVFCVKKKI